MRVTKRLTANDLPGRSHQAGIHIPKRPELLEFFPRLDPDRVNPDCVVTVYLPKLERYWDLRFVYYNGALRGVGKKNEYRLTGTATPLRELGAHVGDSVEFSRTAHGEIRLTVIRNSAGAPSDTSNGRVIELPGGWSLVETT